MKEHVIWLALVAAPLYAQAPSRPTASQERIFFEFEVERPVRPVGVVPKPVYPPELRKSGSEAEVQVEFVVDTLGEPDRKTFKILKTPDERFAQSVFALLPDLRFVAAELRGRKVKQLVRQRFLFAP